ncbi:hypothetical protein SAMN06265348_103289 [Pedobacter westerhofensis]|uniref:Phage integrase family protein n=1 Tax=Pedobacter westerhofensis TaxID=425512 RepID=A0A521C7V7_9SPHI|nr:hypothetical protein [Pedobacter westerhofensis]SMO55455.1 hypothetical protein SAMN06265348_103289 [Pedobacter westerhofensis]
MGQVRQSVITEWLKEKDLRTVQYMAGHRYVSSTERYKTNDLEDLKDALQKFHPLRSSSPPHNPQGLKNPAQPEAGFPLCFLALPRGPCCR